MSSSRRATSVAILALLVMAGASPLLAQDSPCLELSKAGEDWSEFNQSAGLYCDELAKFEGYSRDGSWNLGLTVGVGLLGILIGALQFAKAVWVKQSTIWAGALVAALTLVQENVFPIDNATLSDSKVAAESSLQAARNFLRGFDEDQQATPDDWGVMVDDFNGVIMQLQEVHHPSPLGRAKLAAVAITPGFSLVSRADAQEPRATKPPWATKPPSWDEAYYFVGEAPAKSLRVAKASAYAHALAQATAFLAGQLTKPLDIADFDPDLLARRLVDSGKVEQRFYSRDEASETWTYYCLLRIDHRSAERELAAFEILQRKELPYWVESSLDAQRPDEQARTTARSCTQAQTALDGRILIDFDQAAGSGNRPGDTVSCIEAGGGLVTVRGRATGARAVTNRAMLFDGACGLSVCTGGDHDLNVPSQKNILIISDGAGSDNPGDWRYGGSLEFDFTDLGTVTLESLTVVDLDGELPGFLEYFGSSPNPLGQSVLPTTQEGQSAFVAPEISGVQRLRIVLTGSGAVDDIALTVDGAG